MLIPVQAIIKEMPLYKNVQKQVKAKPNGGSDFKQILDRIK